MSKNPLDSIERWKAPSDKPLGARPSKGSTTTDRRKKAAEVKKIVDRESKPEPTREGISPKMRSMVMERDGYACTLCHSRGDVTNPLEIGHVIPVCQGGTNGEENLRVECRLCNAAGGGRRRQTPEEIEAARWRKEKSDRLYAALAAKKRKR